MDILPELVPPPSRSPSPELLSSDDEGVPPVVPASLRSHPYYLPPLPPKHTYLRTPVCCLTASAPKLAGYLSTNPPSDSTAEESGASVSGEEVEDFWSSSGLVKAPARDYGGYT